ncbi:hypothetical protein, partial [uncultured Marinobacter sp.]|uniref:hypothetical protein n=1 Tax=uncultured Marinobacter sp. TaxID=187379 RepID=UPI0025848781
ASRLDDEVAGLGYDARPEITTQLHAKAHAPNHQKITEALAYNSVLYEPVRISPIRITPIPAAPSNPINFFRINI